MSVSWRGIDPTNVVDPICAKGLSMLGRQGDTSVRGHGGHLPPMERRALRFFRDGEN